MTSPSHPGQPLGPAQPQSPVPPHGYSVQPGYQQPGYPPPGYPPPGYPPPGYRPAPPPVAPGGQPLAEFTDRLLAQLIDLAILFAVGLVIMIPALIAIFALVAADVNENTGELNGGLPLLPVLGICAVVFVLAIGANYIYEVEMMFKRGQTIGKKAMKIQVICLDPGAPLTRGVAAKRWLASFVAAVVIPFWRWIDGLWQLWDKPYRQCLHDKFANTVVVKLPA